MPTFCRHNRFIERCPICSRTLPGNEPAGGAPRRARAAGQARSATGPRRGATGLRVRREGRAAEDGYANELVPGLRASADAARLAEEIDFAAARLAALAIEPPGLYGEARELAGGELERASWICVLCAYLGPTEEEDPFASIRAVLEAAPGPAAAGELGGLLDDAETGPRSSHEPGRGAATLEAYAQWVGRAGDGSQAAAFAGDGSWAAERRFARLFERLALPGFSRAGRYELLVTLGRLGLYEIQADTLQLGGPRVGAAPEDPTVLAAKRVFGIADPLLLDRRAVALAEAAAVPVEALDLALANWVAPLRATAGFPAGEVGLGPVSEAPAALGV